MPRDIEITSYLQGTNAPYIAELYEQYLANPSSVDAGWQKFFAQLNDAGAAQPLKTAQQNTRAHVIGLRDPDAPAASSAKGKATAAPAAGTDSGLSGKVARLIDAYRKYGHFAVALDPLSLTPPAGHPALDPAFHGLSDGDMDQPLDDSTPRQILATLQSIYCSSVGIEYDHIQNPERRAWLIERIEGGALQTPLSAAESTALLGDIIRSDEFERFLHTKFVGAKRFGADGSESIIPAIEEIMRAGVTLGVSEVQLGMAHRGRLNIMCNSFGKPYHDIMALFEGVSPLPDSYTQAWDVKYHLSAATDRTINGKTVHVSLSPNPSHLEAVNPVVLGKARAKQDLAGDTARRQVLPILIHGDAAISAQGIIYECFAMSDLAGYRVGGALHVIINNQIGFTTNPTDSRSSPYCSDLSKMLDCPVFHVNGDDVDAVARVARLITEFRQTFARDAVMDLYGYRRYGHNEGDEPFFTQPTLYAAIKTQPSTRQQYQQRLIDEGRIDPSAPQKLDAEIKAALNKAYDYAQKMNGLQPDWLDGGWKGIKEYKAGKSDATGKTGVDEKTLKTIGKTLCTPPAGFHINAKVARQLETKADMFKTGKGFDWATAEALAFGSLLLEGKKVRLSGQDCKRGTFSHRHAVWFDQDTSAEYAPLCHLSKKQGDFEVLNSPLSEYGVMGFEYGYTQANPHALVCWEGQFGDFANGAQTIIDQFISSAESKWLRCSALTLLLPHGFEGQGPEHSSARFERFLQLCAEDNMQVAYCSTPASYFHVLRRQLLRDFRKPLILMTPKSLLRHKLCVSDLKEMSTGTTFLPVLGEVDKLAADKVKRVLVCTGKVYYDLVEARRAQKQDAVAIVRVEQLYPWPAAELAKELKKYPNAKDIVWVQEEPQNMGAWSFVDRRLEGVLATINHKVTRPVYVGRSDAASPATGVADRHGEEQKRLVDSALSLTQHVVVLPKKKNG